MKIIILIFFSQYYYSNTKKGCEMEKIAISLNDDVYERLTKYMKKKGVKNRSKTINDLLDLALQYEEQQEETKGVSTRKLIELLIYKTELNHQIGRNTFKNTTPISKDISKRDMDLARNTIKKFEKISEDYANKILG